MLDAITTNAGRTERHDVINTTVLATRVSLDESNMSQIRNQCVLPDVLLQIGI